MVMAERGETFNASAKAPEAKPAAAAASKGMTNLQRIRRIEMVLESMRPTLKADGGDVELVEVDGNKIYVNMTGACSGCQLASATLGGIQQRLMEELGEFIKVIPASQMPQAMKAGG